jgi:hypothetical protein
MTLTRVGQLETVIRVPDAASPLPGRFDDFARERLPAALAVAVERALPETREVVVFRHVDLELRLEANASAGAEEITDRWARAAGAAVAALSARGDDRDVVRFPDEASFVAHFVRDLLAGRAWGMWCYGAFRPLRDLSVGAAIARVLTDHALILDAILRALGRDDALEHALATLRPEEARSVWQSTLAHGPQPLDAASALPIAAAALRVARRLRLLAEPAPEPAQLAAGHGRWAPQPLEWSSRAALADAVCGALAELARAGLLRPTTAEVLRQRAAPAVTDLDWLDRERLVTGIVALLDPTATGGAPAEFDAETEALRRVIEAVARESGLKLADDAVTAMRLFAALAERDPKLAARPEAATEIQRLLAQAVRAGGNVPAAARSATVVKDGAAEAGAPWRRCEAAGVLLLARALADTRLGGLASRLELPAPGLAGDPAAALLLSLGLAVAGSAGVDEDGRLDPGLLALLGRDDAVNVTELAAAWSSTDVGRHRTLRAELTELAAGQRLDRPRPVPDCCHPAIPGLARGTTARTAHLAIMAWARWLQGLSGSTPAFLLVQLLRRGGSVSVAADAVRVALDPRPLDAVIELAGYLEPLEGVPGLGGRTLHITRGQT